MSIASAAQNPYEVNISAFLGYRNTTNVQSIPDNALAEALDVDIDDFGAINRRNGYSVAKSISNVTDAYSTFDDTPYIVASGILYRVSPTFDLISITPCAATCYCDQGKYLFTNDGFKVFNDTAVSLITPITELLPPTLSAVPGDWPAGDYGCVYTYRNSTGMESHTSPISTLTITSGQQVSVAPVVEIGSYTPVIYLTVAGGSIFYASDGAQLSPNQLVNNSFPLGGKAMALFDGSLWVAIPQVNGSTVVYFSDPYLYHLYNFSANYIIVPGEVRAMMPTADGEFLMIGSDSGIYAWGNSRLKQEIPHGVIAGRPFARTHEGTVLMFTVRGVYESPPFKAHTDTKAMFPPGSTCSSLVLDQDGMYKFIVLSDGAGIAYDTRRHP